MMSARLLGLFGLLIAILGCTADPNPSEVDRSFLLDEPCAPPCWYGLELDKSNKADIYSTLKALPFVLQNTIREGETIWLDDRFASRIAYGCPYKRESCGMFIISRDRLKEIWMFTAYDLELQAVVEKLGKPNYLIYSQYHPEVGGIQLDAVWPEKSTNARYVNPQNTALFKTLLNGGMVPPNTPVDTIIYIAKEGLDQPPGGCCTRILWPGFSKP